MSKDSRRNIRTWALVAVGVVLVALVANRPGREGTPLDPRGTSPLGAKALVVLLDELGAEVTITSDAPVGGDTAVLLGPVDDPARVDAIREWVAAGGVLVVADPLSDLAPAQERLANPFEVAPAAPGPCEVPALRGIDAVGFGGGLGYRVPPGAIGCFPGPAGAGLVARAEGQGTIVAIAGAGPFLNANLADGDNAALAAALLAPRPGTRVAFLDRGPAGSGQESISSLVPRRVKDAGWQLLLAFALFALWRACRLGRPVAETQPVDLPASEIVVAVGHLLEQARRRSSAAEMLRLQLRRTLADRLGVAVDAPPEAMAAAVAGAQIAVDPAVLERALQPHAVDDNAALVDLASTLHAIRQEVLHAR
ncbi:MAG: hypothetical protein AVDCRST_MAG50-2853 [uncultured Acidimicrobiales bacterium]|uniref:DUF4350 domain-containing protein n=1 Tax=uncultured Acidimicrobiales bacterium TaxID=310071 RepID=A0A6J4IUU8_9ACTN|nr:MAG: hypothetical protein AVDCRST_MAG50-2853 [uncultured Acidimicrobiales bacterium]